MQDQTKPQNFFLRSSMRPVTAAFILIASASAMGVENPLSTPQKQGNVGSDFCSQTTQVSSSSCFYEVQEEFWAGWGACTNISNPTDRSDCFDDISANGTESLDECAEQEEGRNEVCELLGEGRYDPKYKPGDFVDPTEIGDSVDPNPYFPLVPGYRWVYEADGEVIIVEVLEDTKMIDGVLCAVVRDIVIETEEEEGDDEDENFLQEDDDMDEDVLGDPVEDTLDWYAQDKHGNVWYFGEISLNYEDGEVTDVDGSWQTGVDHAHPGVLMYSMPAVGAVYRQEFLLGEAEDMALVISTSASPDLGEDNVGDCSLGCLKVEEWTPLESDSLEYKYYQAGVGMVLEAKPGSDERVELVEFTAGETDD